MSENTADLEEQLSRIDLFSSLSGRHLKKLIGRSRVVKHPPGKHVAQEGFGALAFHLVLEGQATVKHGDTTLRTLKPGEYFGEMSLIDGRPRSMTVIADGPLTTFAVPHQVFQDLIDSEPAFARALLVVLSQRLRDVEARAATRG